MNNHIKTRCSWAGDNPLCIAYHDEEWGRPVHDDRKLFEFLALESAQAGLSWITILKKRQAYREAFDDFDAASIAFYGESKVRQLMLNPGIVRNQRKILSLINNARCVLALNEQQTFNEFFWKYVDFTPINNKWLSADEVPAQTELSVRISKDLKSLGFSFVGPTIVYAFMQAIGMVNDHTSECFLYKKN